MIQDGETVRIFGSGMGTDPTIRIGNSRFCI
jgi:hypothetical protein